MQKAAIVLITAAVLAVVAFSLLMKSRRPAAEAPGGPVAVHRGSGSGAGPHPDASRLRQENDALAKENAELRRRAEAAESRIAKIEDESREADPKKSGAKKADWKKRRDAELEAKVKGLTWRQHTRGVIDYWKELEKSRAEGRAPQMQPDMMKALNALQADMVDLSKFLGLEGGNSYEVFQNEVVGAAWQDAFLQEIGGGSITEDQLARLRATSLYEQDPDWGLGGGNILETWKKLIERNQAYGTATAGILTPEQHAQMSKTVTPTYMLSLYAGYSERPFAGAAAVTDYWLDSFKLAPENRAAVEAVAGDLAKRLSDLSQTYASQYGASLPREADFELRLKSIELQIAAERRLAETLPLDGEQAKKLLKGSGAVIKITH